MLQFLIDLEPLVHPGLYNSILLFFSQELIDMYMTNQINTDDFRAIRYMIRQAKIK
jgi:hypothetical protein